jgi:hypothetical protein
LLSCTQFSFGDDGSLLGEHAWHQGNSEEATHRGSAKKRNPWRLGPSGFMEAVIFHGRVVFENTLTVPD